MKQVILGCSLTIRESCDTLVLKSGMTANSGCMVELYNFRTGVKQLAFTRQQKDLIRKGSWVLFLMYMAVMAYFLFFSEALNRTNDMVYQYNLVLFQEIKRGFWCLEHGNFQYFFLNVVLNVAAFAPFGFILPIISPKNRKFFNIFLLSLELTLVIEVLQLVFRVGIFDVDDIFMNTLGGTLGYFLYMLCYQILLKQGKRGKL